MTTVAPTRFDRTLGWLVPLATFGYLLAYPLAPNTGDEGIFLYGARRVLEGQVPYRDFFEFITPGCFYFFAGVFALTGPSLRAARYAMASIELVSAALLFSLTRRIAGTAEAVLAVLVFIMVCYPAWNNVNPHWISTCLCLGVAAAFLAERWSDRTRAVLTGFLAAVTFCVQQQRGVFIAGWVAVSVTIFAWLAPRGERLRWWLRQAGWMAAVWLVVVGSVLGYSAWRATPELLVYALYTFVFESYRKSYNGKVAWAGSFFKLGPVVPTWVWMLRWLPVALVVEAVALGWRLRVVRERPEATRAALLLLGAAMAASILYFPDYIHVAIVAPFLLIVAARGIYGLRRLSPVARSRVGRGLALAVLVVAGGAVVAKGWSNLWWARYFAPERATSAMGPLALQPDQKKLLEAVQAAALNGGQTLFSYPSDSWLYLATGTRNPTRYALLLRSYNTPAQFDDAIDALERSRTRYIVVAAWAIRSPDDPIMHYLEGRYERVAEPPWYAIYRRIR